uniref:NADH dehydrogenase subunit 6 n=1 Tax=Kulikovia alborostrata TaxID=187796 RepID=I6MR67_9BILA|nr:NADH dehydrogenase subunit 6 [Kulikovia alborostrata]AEM23545.1 NADH dehydrogenase subunit 6 [Kulikovia alborostrata]
MFLALFSGLMLSFIFFLPMVQQGVFMVVVVFSLVILMSTMIGFVGLSWYGFSFFLIYEGGLLVMFGYVISMIPNFFFDKSKGGWMVLVVIFFASFFPFKFFLVDGLEEKGGFLYSMEGCLVVIGLGFVLFLSLVCVVKVCYFSKGSLRPFSV